MPFFEDNLLYLSIIAIFIIAYPISMLEYGYRKFQNNYLLLFRISIPFHIYGIAHGILASLIYWILWKKGFLPIGDIAHILNPICIGAGIKGITNLNFYSIVNSSSNNNTSSQNENFTMTPVGPKLIMDSIEKYSASLIENSHDRYLDKYINNSIKNCLKKIKSDTIVDELVKHLPHSTKKIIRYAFKQEVDQSIKDNNQDLYFAMRLFVNEYGLSRYKRFIEQLRYPI